VKRAVFLAFVFLFLSAGYGHAGGRAHPFLIVEQDMFPELQDRASATPWMEMKAFLLSHIKLLK